jgi:hypothetical protein
VLGVAEEEKIVADDKNEPGNRGSEKNLAGIDQIAIARHAYQRLLARLAGTAV